MQSDIEQYEDCFGCANRLFWNDGHVLFESKEGSGGHVADFEDAKQAELVAELLNRLCRRVCRKRKLPIDQRGIAIPVHGDWR
jgi:hypothetical protein